ncbi:hypothetical protein CLOP_g11529 [Closterium sp. NIES-67]|nr:hypothetical protein CLOP_g11529 [Closterium sp. NIES-67]
MAVTEVTSAEAFNTSVKEGAPVAVHFWAAWCEPCKHMDVVFAQLAAENPHAKFLRVEAEEVPDLSETYSVSAVPFFLFFKDGKVVDRLEGANPPELSHKVALHVAARSPAVTAGGFAAAEVIESVLHSARTASYSTPPAATPATASSTDPNTQPEQPSRMIAPPAGSDKPKLSPDLKARIEALLASHPVLLFMKGSPSAPRCGFSSKVVSVLEKDLGSAASGAYGSFDILGDEEIRQGLKVYSDWPTFPQVYCKGELVGGCDIVLQMHESGELKELFVEKGVVGGGGSGAAAVASEAAGAGATGAGATVADGKVGGEKGLQERLQALVSKSPTMLFMKGTPEEPRCGFSRKVVDALRSEGIPFGSFDILADEEVRQGLKSLSNWPTYPQLYHKGELVGGCDIVLEMKANGELKAELAG